MEVFSLAISIGLVLYCLSGLAVKLCVEAKLSHDHPAFQISAIIFVINRGLLDINVTILLAILVKNYLL